MFWQQKSAYSAALTAAFSIFNVLPSAAQELGIPAIGAVVNGTSSLAPANHGSVITIYGINLAKEFCARTAADTEPSICNTSATLFTDGANQQRPFYKLPILFVSPGQINAIIPKDVENFLGTKNVAGKEGWITVTNSEALKSSEILMPGRQNMVRLGYQQTSVGLNTISGTGTGLAVAQKVVLLPHLGPNAYRLDLIDTTDSKRALCEETLVFYGSGNTFARAGLVDGKDYARYLEITFKDPVTGKSATISDKDETSRYIAHAGWVSGDTYFTQNQYNILLPSNKWFQSQPRGFFPGNYNMNVTFTLKGSSLDRPIIQSNTIMLPMKIRSITFDKTLTTQSSRVVRKLKRIPASKLPRSIRRKH